MNYEEIDTRLEDVATLLESFDKDAAEAHSALQRATETTNQFVRGLTIRSDPKLMLKSIWRNLATAQSALRRIDKKLRSGPKL